VKEKDDDARQWSTRNSAIADDRRRRRHDGTGDLDVSIFWYLFRAMRQFFYFFFSNRASEGVNRFHARIYSQTGRDYFFPLGSCDS